MKLLFNIKFNQFLQKIIIPNLLLLQKIKKIIAYTTNYYSFISSILNFSLIIKLLMKNIVFNYQFDKKSNKSEFIYLYICKSKFISTKNLFKLC